MATQVDDVASVFAVDIYPANGPKSISVSWTHSENDHHTGMATRRLHAPLENGPWCPHEQREKKKIQMKEDISQTWHSLQAHAVI